ncbi:MAG: hypothetical protein HWE26_20865 [Alteromonadaceae bacterium]|nr:hypothetical protein [Alteromonadaceae bacterium]
MNNFALITLLSGGLLLAPAVQSETLQEGVAACKLIKADRERLACFDALTISTTQPGPSRSQTPDSQSASISKAKAKLNVPAEHAETSTELKKEQPLAVARANEAVTERKGSQADPANEFGLAPKSPVEEIQRITSTVTNVKSGPLGRRSVYLKNGSVWKQTDSSRMRLKNGQDVYVERGLLGSFYMSYDGVNSRIKVKRIK